jgi:hypothetical protein
MTSSMRSRPRTAGKGGLGRRRFRFERRRVLVVEALADGGELTGLEFDEAQSASSVGRADQGAEHQLQHRLLAEAVRDDLQPSHLRDEQALQQVRRPRRPAVLDRCLRRLLYLEAMAQIAARRGSAHSGASGRSFQRHPVKLSGVSGHAEPLPLSLVS